ncbi:MAG TPA: helix-hairpin-helix domain-containing protein [Thermoleophilaceae bacterium]
MDESDRLRLVVWGAIALLVLFAGWRLLGDRAGASEASVKFDGPGAAAPSRARPAREPPARVYVAVVGSVRRPGLYRVPTGARVAAAVARAGGLGRGADLTGVNLAARVHDGQQIVVPKLGAAAAGAVAGGPTSATTGPISLSTATVEQLDGLEGIGPALAQRIVAYRQSHGGFRSIEELGQVEGIGDKRLAALRSAVTP